MQNNTRTSGATQIKNKIVASKKEVRKGKPENKHSVHGILDLALLTFKNIIEFSTN